jgi:class 3 adenylate cyclase/pimeloyl-ACP methyl ester carboxylesterase
VIGHGCEIEAEFLDMEDLGSEVSPRPAGKREDLEAHSVGHIWIVERDRSSLQVNAKPGPGGPAANRAQSACGVDIPSNGHPPCTAARVLESRVWLVVMQTVSVDDVRYARHGEAHVAFREVVGDASSDTAVLWCPGQFVPMEMMWADRGYARFVDGLASLGRLVVFDRRGIGLSDAVTDWSTSIYDKWVDDAVSVLDAAGVDTVNVVGWEQGATLAWLLATRHPDRISRVAVLHGLDRMERMATMGWPSGRELAASMRRWIETGDGDELPSGGGESYAPSRAGDASLELWLNQAGRMGASPTMAVRLYESVFTDNTGLDLADLSCPAVLLWRRDTHVWPKEVGRAIAADFPGIDYVEIAGEDFAPYSGDVDGLVNEIERFITGEATRAGSGDRQLSAVLFTDIVGSTESVSSIGDGAWRGTLDAHDRVVDRVVGRHGGRVIKQTGDGALIIFDLASRAMRAAVALREELGSLGIVVRQGVHAGEVVARGDDVSGVAVHVASRVMSLAEPGEILTSAVVPMLIEGDNMVFVERASTSLRGLPGDRTIYALSDQSDH